MSTCSSTTEALLGSVPVMRSMPRPTTQCSPPTCGQPTSFLTAAIAPRMVSRRHGSIINLGSIAGSVGLAGGDAYSATKAALEAMTRAWAAEYSPAGVRVNAVAPGPVYTASPEQVIRAIGETTILKRAAQPERDRGDDRLPCHRSRCLHYRRDHRGRRRPHGHLSGAFAMRSTQRGGRCLCLLCRCRRKAPRRQMGCEADTISWPLSRTPSLAFPNVIPASCFSLVERFYLLSNEHLHCPGVDTGARES